MPRTIATNTEIDRDGLTDFLRPRHHMILLTWRRDGSAQGSPVTAGVDDEGRIVVATYPERAKAVNVARRPQASVIVLSEEWGGPWVQVDGDAELITLPDAVEPLVDYFRAISGEHPDWAEYRAVMVADRRVLMSMRVERVYGEKLG